MTLDFILTNLWIFLNSAIGLTLVGSLVLFALNKVYAAKPAWKAYEGSIIAAIKYAEKAVPDNTPEKSLQRLDCALKYVLNVYAQRNGSAASEAVANVLREAIQVKHAELEAGPEIL